MLALFSGFTGSSSISNYFKENASGFSVSSSTEKPFASISKATSTTTRLATGSRIAAKTIWLILIGLPKVMPSVLPYTPRGSSKEPILAVAVGFGSFIAPRNPFQKVFSVFLI